MPKLTRKNKRRRDDESVADSQLMLGYVMFNCEEQCDDEAALRASWESRRDRIMEEYLFGDHYGKRPWAWWEYDSAEPRNKSIDEYDQLDAMGELTDHERNEKQLARQREKAMRSLRR